MDLILFNSDKKIESALIERREKVVTLLVSEQYYNLLSSEDQKRLAKKLPYLLKRYAKFMSSHSRLNDQQAVTTLYQRNQGRMKKLNVRMNTVYWSLLGALAQSHGVSRCYLFNFLLSLDKMGVGESVVKVLNVGIPTFHKVYRYIWQLELDRNKISRSLEFIPNPLQSFAQTGYF
ncbi:DUF1564 domain-containing protein [Leptospira sp. WS92.C1]